MRAADGGDENELWECVRCGKAVTSAERLEGDTLDGSDSFGSQSGFNEGSSVLDSSEIGSFSDSEMSG